MEKEERFKNLHSDENLNPEDDQFDTDDSDDGFADPMKEIKRRKQQSEHDNFLIDQIISESFANEHKTTPKVKPTSLLTKRRQELEEAELLRELQLIEDAYNKQKDSRREHIQKSLFFK